MAKKKLGRTKTKGEYVILTLMYNFVTGFLVLMTVGYAGFSYAVGHWIIAFICLIAAWYFYSKLDISV
jgi:uncharacterized membrane protein